MGLNKTKIKQTKQNKKNTSRQQVETKHGHSISSVAQSGREVHKLVLNTELMHHAAWEPCREPTLLLSFVSTKDNRSLFSVAAEWRSMTTLSV